MLFVSDHLPTPNTTVRLGWCLGSWYPDSVGSCGGVCVTGSDVTGSGVTGSGTQDQALFTEGRSEGGAVALGTIPRHETLPVATGTSEGAG